MNEIKYLCVWPIVGTHQPEVVDFGSVMVTVLLTRLMFGHPWSKY